ASSSRSTRRPTTRSAATYSARLGACRSAATWCARTVIPCVWSQFAKTASRRCGYAITRSAGPTATRVRSPSARLVSLTRQELFPLRRSCQMWSVKLTDSQLDALRALLKAQGEVGPSLGGALEALEYARWDDLPEAELDWERVSEMARIQGIGEADVVWDLAAGMSTAMRSSSNRQRRRPPARRPPPARRNAA